MKKIVSYVFLSFLVACVYAPSQAWKPHVAQENNKKYKSPKPLTTKSDKKTTAKSTDQSEKK